MPEFLKDNKRYYTPVEYAMDKIGGTYKMPILWRLKDRDRRYSELKVSIGRISDRMLSKNLRELVDDGFIRKEIFPTIPSTASYSLLEKGRKAIPVIGSLRSLGFELMQADNIPVEPENRP